MNACSRTNSLFLLTALTLCAACSATATTNARSATGSPAGAGAPAATGSPESGREKIGVIAPASFDAVSIWPEAYAGPLLVLEAQPAGARVKKDDVLVRLDSRPIDEQIHEAELEEHSAEVRHRAQLDRGHIDEENARSQLEQARSSLARAKRALEGYKSHELAFAKRADELQKRHEQANVDDQVDELSQDQKMYEQDQIVTATEDFVLKRARRALALTQASTELSRDRSQYRFEYEQAMQTEQREEAVRVQSEQVERLVASQEIDRRTRADAETRSREALALQQTKLERLRHDRSYFELRAPRDGVLLYGSIKDYRPGKTPPRYERGNQLATRADLLLVADPGTRTVAFDLDDHDRAAWKDGARLVVRPLGVPDAAQASDAAGSLRTDALVRREAPDKNQFEATVKLAGGDAEFGRRVRVVLEETSKTAQPAQAVGP